MLGHEDREARRTARYLDALLSAAANHGGDRTADVPASTDVDPAVRRAARRIRADLVPVHPSFRFQEELAAKLSAAARTRAAGDGFTMEAEREEFGPNQSTPGTRTGNGEGLPQQEAPERVMILMRGSATATSHRLARPLLVGGVAASALSIGAVYVAWRFTRPGTSAPPAIPAAAAALATTAASAASTTAASAARSLHRGRRSAVLHGILGVVS